MTGKLEDRRSRLSRQAGLPVLQANQRERLSSAATIAYANLRGMKCMPRIVIFAILVANLLEGF